MLRLPKNCYDSQNCRITCSTAIRSRGQPHTLFSSGYEKGELLPINSSKRKGKKIAIPRFHSRNVLSFSSLGSEDMYDCVLEMNESGEWRPVFSTSFSSKYGSEKVIDYVYVQRNFLEIILRVINNPSGVETPVFEDHGGCRPGFLLNECFSWWKSNDWGATWSRREESSEPSSEKYFKLEVEDIT